MVPQGLVRALATRPIVLGEGDDEDEEEDAEASKALAGEAQDGGDPATLALSTAAVALSAKQATRFNEARAGAGAAGSDDGSSDVPVRTRRSFKVALQAYLAAMTTWVSSLWRTRRLVLTTGKRKLRAGHLVPLWLCWPIFLIGATFARQATFAVVRATVHASIAAQVDVCVACGADRRQPAPQASWSSSSTPWPTPKQPPQTSLWPSSTL